MISPLMSASLLLAATLLYAYTVVGEDGRPVARAITDDERCPAITVAGTAPVAMTVRAGKVEVPVRTSGQADSKPARFPVLVCEHELPQGATSARVGDRVLPMAKAEPRRIVLIGDTGCRMKASEDAWQKCDEQQWPFEQVARSAAALKPDLIVHLGDMHYRESPCVSGNTACSDGPWGYGFDAWEADFFKPAARLLEAAPWVVVRGNHESCFRAGQGWFRFLDPRRFAAGMSCDDPSLDSKADFSDPYAVPIGRGAQFIVFDSSRISGTQFKSRNAMFDRYASDLRQVDALAARSRSSIFLSHHPALGLYSARGGAPLPGNPALQQVMDSVHPGTLFPGRVTLAMHGHVHLFQALSFGKGFPATIVAGNSASQMPDPVFRVPTGFEAAPGAAIARFTGHGRFGFLLMDRDGDGWRFTSYDGSGLPIVRCRLDGRDLRCGQLLPPFN